METGNTTPSKVGAILIGLVEMGISLICALMGVFMLVIPLPNTAAPAGGHQMLIAGSFYLLCGAFFLTFAVGTIIGKRWARTLMLIISWFWLASGVLGLGNMIYMWPNFEKTLEATPGTQPGLNLVIETVMLVFFVTFFIVLPGIFILFYGRKKAKAHFEAWDPKESWTDKCPTPVLAMSLCAGLGALFLMAVIPFFHFVFLFFGSVLVGWPGALLSLAMAAVLIYVAWGTYNLKMAAWWTLLGVYIFWGISTVWTFAIHPMLEIDEKIGIDATNLEGVKNMDYLNNTQYWATYIGIVFAIYIAYLFFIRKYFKQAGR